MLVLTLAPSRGIEDFFYPFQTQKFNSNPHQTLNSSKHHRSLSFISFFLHSPRSFRPSSLSLSFNYYDPNKPCLNFLTYKVIYSLIINPYQKNNNNPFKMSMNSSSSAGGSGSNAGGGNGGAGGGPCGACKFLRRKCLPGCIFAPYFDPENGANHFASVHKVFGASNVSKLLLTIPIQRRPDAVLTIVYEAQARLRDPIYGCVSHIFTLQQQITTLQNELSYLQAQLAELPQPPPPLQQAAMAAAMPATYDLSTLFDPMAQQSPWNMMQQRAMDPRYQYVGGSTSASGGGSGAISGIGGGAGDLHSLARELLHRLGNAPSAAPPGVTGTNASLSHPHSK